MNFQLRICGIGQTCFQFVDIDPQLALDDFLGCFVAKCRNSLRGAALSKFVSTVNNTVILLDDEGVERRLLCGPAKGGKVGTHNAAPLPRYTMCREAFDFLDTGSRSGQCGWIYFGMQTQTVRCVVKLRDLVGGAPSSVAARQGGKHQAFDVASVDLLFGDVLDLKEAISNQLPVAPIDLAVLSPETGAAPSFELLDSALLFRCLCSTGNTSLKVVQREGVAVTVRYHGSLIQLPRFPPGACVGDVKQRLARNFSAECGGGIYLEGHEGEGQLQDAEQLGNLLNEHGDVHLIGERTRITSHLPQAGSVHTNFESRGVKLVNYRSPPRNHPAAPLPQSAKHAAGAFECRVTITGFPNQTKPVAVEVALPDSGSEYTGLDLKEFILANDIVQNCELSSLVLLNGKHEVGDHEDLYFLFPSDHMRDQFHNAQLLLELRHAPRHRK